MIENTDEQLWQGYISGEEGSFEALFSRHKDKVFNFALRLLSSRADAEDVTSDVFLQLFYKKFQYDGRAKLTTWLFTVARNACMTRLRSTKGVVSMWFKKSDADDFEAWDMAGSGPLPGDELARRETSKSVRKALLKLPQEQKQALILREYFQKDYQEIAQILECSLEKVKVLIFRAREAMRQNLAPIIKENQS